MSLGTRSVRADRLQAGQWIVHSNERMNQRIVAVEETRDGQVKVSHDFGNGGESATSFFEAEERLTVL